MIDFKTQSGALWSKASTSSVPTGSRTLVVTITVPATATNAVIPVDPTGQASSGRVETLESREALDRKAIIAIATILGSYIILSTICVIIYLRWRRRQRDRSHYRRLSDLHRSESAKIYSAESAKMSKPDLTLTPHTPIVVTATRQPRSVASEEQSLIRAPQRSRSPSPNRYSDAELRFTGLGDPLERRSSTLFNEPPQNEFDGWERRGR